MDELNPNNLENFDKIDTVDLQVEMARSYLDYAMSVIVGRALPDVRDGLKPVHRRRWFKASSPSRFVCDV